MEQFGFLENRQTVGAIRVSREVLHMVKTKNLESLILKLDLVKAYDKVDWVYLRLVLLHIGLPYQLTEWIMPYVSYASFTVLVNGFTSPLFKSSRVLRQGYPMYPIVFLLVS